MKNGRNNRKDKIFVIELIQSHIVKCIVSNNTSNLNYIIYLHSKYIDELTEIIEVDFK